MFFVILLYRTKGENYCDVNSQNTIEWESICSETCGEEKRFRDQSFPFSFSRGDFICFTRTHSESFIIPEENVEIIIGRNVKLKVEGVERIEREDKNNTKNKNIMKVNGNVIIHIQDEETSIFNLREVEYLNSVEKKKLRKGIENESEIEKEDELYFETKQYEKESVIDFSNDCSSDDTLICILDHGILSITGNGQIDYTYTPWNNKKQLITDIIIGDEITTIQQGAFSDCENLINVKLGKNLKIIESKVFSYCTSLKSIRIPDSVTTINSEAFSHCTNLTSIFLGSSLYDFDPHSSFSYCTNLEKN